MRCELVVVSTSIGKASCEEIASTLNSLGDQSPEVSTLAELLSDPTGTFSEAHSFLLPLKDSEFYRVLSDLDLAQPKPQPQKNP